MSTETLILPFDPTGQAASNLREDERHVISPPADNDFYLVVPRLAPYYRDSLVITEYPGGREWVAGVDYLHGHYFYAASRSIGQMVYGSIHIYNRTYQGTLSIRYQSIGGEWTLDEQGITELLANVILDPRITTWEQVTDVPSTFPPINHEWNIVDMVGMTQVVGKLEEIEQAILARDAATGSSHLTDYDNPHQTTKAQTGLGLVENYPPASNEEAVDGIRTDRYMTPATTQATLVALGALEFQSHIEDENNPHGTDKSQVGLDAVENYPVATQALAEEGLANNAYMTPLRTNQAFDVFFALELAQEIDVWISLLNYQSARLEEAALVLITEGGDGLTTEGGDYIGP